jgi:hypothetical protein
MIFIGREGKRFLIIEPGNIQRLKEGLPLVSPDGLVLVFTNDPKWTFDQILSMFDATGGNVDEKLLDFIFKEGVKRPEVQR